MSVIISGFRASRGLVAVLGTVTVLLGGLAVAVPASAEPTATTESPAATVDPTSKASVLQAYQQTWLPALAVPSGWTGSTASCSPGVNSVAGQRAVLQAVNFARALVGRTPVRMDTGLSAKALTGALIQDASGSLNHTPPNTAPCWTATGADASGRSNLSLDPFNTVTAASPIATYLDDPGTGNVAAGHRRWVLFSQLALIGSGTTTHANALYVIDVPSWRPSPAGSKVAAWPSAGYFPAQLEPDGRWSVSIPGADFSTATVTVRHNGQNLPTTVTSRGGPAYGDNSLVWSVAPQYDIGQGDQAFDVTVRGYKIAGVTHNTAYTTTLIDGTIGLRKRNVISFPWPGAKNVGVTFNPRAKNNNGLPVYYGTATPNVCRGNFNPSSVTTLAPGTCEVFAYVGQDPRWPDAPVETRTFTVRG